MSKTTPKRFRQELQEEIENPSPRGERIVSMQGRLRRFINNIRRRAGWSVPSPNVIPTPDFQQRQEDAINDEIIALMQKYRDQLMSSRVTERAAHRILNEVRDWTKHEYMKGNYISLSSPEDIENFAPFLFHASAENRVEDFERLHSLGVIDAVEYYLLFALYHRETAKSAAELIEMPEATARKVLERARANVQEHINELGTGAALISPKPTNDKRVRTIDQDLLMNAIRHILGAPR